MRYYPEQPKPIEDVLELIDAAIELDPPQPTQNILRVENLFSRVRPLIGRSVVEFNLDSQAIS